MDQNRRTPPSTLEVMLHCYYSPTPVPNADTQSVRCALSVLRLEGMIETDPDDVEVNRATERGQAWVEMICCTPYPERVTKWVDPRTMQ